MLTTAGRNRSRFHLYVVSIACQTGFSIILPLVPFVNEVLNTTSLQYSLTFSGYYLSMILSSIIFGALSDRIGRRMAIVVSLFGLTLGSVVCYTTSNVYVFIAARVATGLMDNMVALGQAYMADITPLRERPRYFAQLESVMNFTQCIGPLVGGILSKVDLYIPLYLAIVLYAFSFVYAFFLLPESVYSVVEKKEILATFNRVNQSDRGRTSLLDMEESQRIQEEFLKQMRKQEMERMKNAKLTMNYLIVIAIIGEFCNKWVFSIFDTVVSIYGMEHFQLDAFMFGVMSCIGSLVNMVQTGWLFTFLIHKDFSIPTMASWAGIVGALAMFLCVAQDKNIFILGGIVIIVAYGFAAPAPPAIVSVGLRPGIEGRRRVTTTHKERRCR
ncbi:Tetracycline resistance protein [Blastocystis hominis]|uniref:Tetracycline resistance protein n=1 Tax=Blastocystis hominis TaxID=12968 RepID=D8M9L7_BLAHO|nr:Tetracycline resistance protein [Blastocystis hominis]CBK24756.2 Tetracycline resistance protein [Blastocystis hominis]|eukprot:XP_012898804.1 Tetracycline resistance protein [Blastocystis hominis]